MKLFRCLLIVVSAFIILVACKEESDSKLITSTTQLTFSPNGGSQTLDIESNTEWRIVSNVSWLSAYPLSGSQNQQVTITVAIKDNQLEQTATLIAMTLDGTKVVNITVKVEGSMKKTGKHLEVIFHRQYIGGKQHSTAVIDVVSNISWEVLGPDWIETWDGSRWRPLSETRGVISGNGTGKINIRTAYDNLDEMRKMGIISIRECLTGEYLQTISVMQVGRMETQTEIMTTLENGVVFGWTCGCDVQNIYFKATNNMNEEIPDDNTIRNTYEKTDQYFLNSAVDLKVGEQYRILSIAEDASGNISKYSYSTVGTTAKERSPFVMIGVGVPDEKSGWQFLVNMSSDAVQYLFYASENPNSAFQYNDPILFHIARTEWGDFTMVYNSSGWINWRNLSLNPREVHAFAVAVGTGDEMTWRMSRYDRYYDADGNLLPAKPLLDRIPKSLVGSPSLR